MLKKRSLSTKLASICVALLLVALTSIVLSLWFTWKLEGGAAAVNEAGRMRMQAWRLASVAQTQSASHSLDDLLNQFDASLGVLKNGDAARPLSVPWNDEIRAEFNKVSLLWLTQRGQWTGANRPDPDTAMRFTGELVTAVDGFVSSIEHQLTRFTAILNLYQIVMMALAIVGAVLTLYTGHLFVISPLAYLQRGLRRVESGDFTTRIEVDTQDEFGQVTAGFNGMASKLQVMYEGLEAQVEAKTRHIEAQHARLAALYEVSAFLASSNTIEDMSRGFAKRVRTVLHADALVVRVFDEANQRALMLVCDGWPSDLQENERSLLTGACACGTLKHDARTRVIPLVSLDEVPLGNCVRAGYESMVSVPIRLQQRLIGEVNLFFRTPVQLSAEEVALLDALVSHLASAREGLRAAALEREAAVGEERALLARELHDSIAQSLAFLKIQLQLLRNAWQKTQATQVENALNELDVGLRESIGDVRELLLHFRTRTNTDHIEVALQETLQKFKYQTGLPAQMSIKGEGLPLPADVQVQVLHVIQEALSNIRKHAAATQVTLEVNKGEKWRFAICDNGLGFDATARSDETHVGLKIMRERAARIGAQVEVNSEPSAGTRVLLTLPLHPVSSSGQGPVTVTMSL